MFYKINEFLNSENVKRGLVLDSILKLIMFSDATAWFIVYPPLVSIRFCLFEIWILLLFLSVPFAQSGPRLLTPERSIEKQ